MGSRSLTTHHGLSVPGCIARPEQLRNPLRHARMLDLCEAGMSSGGVR